MHKIFSSLIRNQFLIAITVAGFAWLLFQVRGIIVAIFLAYIIMAALYPLVQLLIRKGITKSLAVFLVFIVTLLLLVLLIFPLIPFFVSQVQSFIVKFPLYLKQLSPLFGLDIDAKQIQGIVNDRVTTIGENALAVSAKIFGGFFTGITIIVVSFYLLLAHDDMNKGFIRMFPKQNRDEVKDIILRVEDKLGSWLRGQLVLSISVGVLTWIALTVAGVEYALPLAIMAGLLEILPTIGPIIAAVPAVIVALSTSPTLAFITIGIYVVIQLLENHILVPRIMAKAVGLNPLVVLLGIIIGAKLLGVAGALLSVPFISLITVIINSIQVIQKKETA